MKKVASKILIMNLIILGICLIVNKNYCAIDPNIKMEIKSGGTTWTSITASDSYDECQYLNNTSSSLGTESMKAHLTTPEDWSAMGIFSASQYGGATANNPESTNNNASGIYNVGVKYNYIAGAINTITKTNDNASIYENRDSKYVSLYNPERLENSFVGIIGTFNWKNSGSNWQKSGLVFVKGLFGIQNYYAGNQTGNTGGKGSSFTFRPALWN